MEKGKVEQKKQAFEYLVTKLIEWKDDLASQQSSNSFTKIKVLKLLFFVSAVKDENKKDLLDIFDNFYAMPYGPVESDIYNFINKDELDNYSFSDVYMELKSPRINDNLDSTTKSRIDNAIDTLKKNNRNIITLRAFELVDISHKWNVWKNSMKVAELLGKSSQLMPIEEIRANLQIFS